MPESTFVISLPIGDRRTSAAFYTRFLGREPFGGPSDDGVPEPLQFSLGADASMMLIPSGGFGWVIGDMREVARPPASECVISIQVDGEADVDERTNVAREAGAEVLSEPAPRAWGYVAVVADPDGHLWQIIHIR